MTSLEIQAFLTVQQTLSISRAAEQLYISQSSLSSRLQTLEQELGAPLFVRGRGRRELSLTAEGERFLPLARQHRALEDRMLTVAHPEPRSHLLRISTLSSVGNCLLPPVYDRFLLRWPEIRLELRAYSSSSVRQMLARDKLDLAFSTLSYHNESITSIHLANEPMALICSEDSDYSDPVPLSALSPDRQVYTFWNSDLSAWQSTVFGPDFQPQVRLELISQLPRFLAQPNAWSILPESVARTLQDRPGLRRCEMDFTPPFRPLHLQCRRAALSTPPVQHFLDTLRQVLTEQQFPGLIL